MLLWFHSVSPKFLFSWEWQNKDSVNTVTLRKTIIPTLFQPFSWVSNAELETSWILIPVPNCFGLSRAGVYTDTIHDTMTNSHTLYKMFCNSTIKPSDFELELSHTFYLRFSKSREDGKMDCADCSSDRALFDPMPELWWKNLQEILIRH